MRGRVGRIFMKNKRIYHIIVLSLLLPFLAGCQGGGSSQLGSLFAGPASGLIADLLPLSNNSEDTVNSGEDGGEGENKLAIASVHNPEPVSLALFGTGISALALLRRKKKP